MENAYMIFMTGFAVFGLYCFLEMIFSLITGLKSPGSVTVMRYSESAACYRKLRSVQSSVFNNEILFIGENDRNIYPGTFKRPADEAGSRLREILFKR